MKTEWLHEKIGEIKAVSSIHEEIMLKMGEDAGLKAREEAAREQLLKAVLEAKRAIMELEAELETSEFHHSVNGGQGGILSVLKNHRDQRGDYQSFHRSVDRWFLTMNRNSELIGQMEGLLEEVEVYEKYRQNLERTIKKLADEYQSKKYGYIEYQNRMKESLKGKTKEEMASYYNSYIYSLLKKIELLLSELYNRITESRREIIAKKAEKTAQQESKIEREYIVIERAVEKKQERAEKGYAQLSVPRRGYDFDERISAVRAKLSGGMPGYKMQTLEYVVVKMPRQRQKYAYAETPQQIMQPQEAKQEAISETMPEAPEIEGKKGLFWLKVKEKITAIALKLRNAAASLAKIRFKIPSIKAGKKEQTPAQKTAEEIDFAKIGQKPKIYPEQQIMAIHKKEGEGAIRANAISNIGAAVLKVPLKIGRFSIFLAKLPVRTALSGVKLAFGAARLIGNLKKGKIPVQEKEKKGQKSFFERMGESFSMPKKSIFVEEIVGIEKEVEKSEMPKIGRKPAGVLAGGILNAKLFTDLFSRMGRKEEKIMAEETEIPEHIKKLREMRARYRRDEREYGFEQTLLAREAKRVKEAIGAERAEEYKGSSLGTMANLFVKKTSVSLVNTFPELFENLYNALRAANIKVLSNTYVSIMVFISMIMFLTVTSTLTIIFFALNYPLYAIVARSFFLGFMAASLTAVFFYAYPFMRISERKKNITANMPFAMNHLAAVASSGVPPSAMMELISESKEYGEISIEFKKIVDLMNIFGYDLLTAIRTAATTTPSPAFKEILDGMVSTIETGGDLESYLKEKAEESTLTYRLERQKYNETISTYSDIYTGLLIAAPLFFVAALAIINLLGGTIAGFGIAAIMAFGAYIAIPLLNIAFLLFLQINQPQA